MQTSESGMPYPHSVGQRSDSLRMAYIKAWAVYENPTECPESQVPAKQESRAPV